MDFKKMSPEDEHRLRTVVLNHFSKMMGDLQSGNSPVDGMVVKETDEMPPEISELHEGEIPEGLEDLLGDGSHDPDEEEDEDNF